MQNAFAAVAALNGPGVLREGNDAMRLATYEFYLREALLSLRRNRLMTVAAIMTVAVSFLILGLFVLLVNNLNYMAGTLEDQVEIAAFVDPERSPASIRRLEEQIDEIPGVQENRFVSQDEALDRLREQFGERAGLLTAVDEMNPLRHSFEISVAEPEQVEAVADEIADLTGVEEVRYQQEVVERLFTLTHSIRVGGLVVVALLLLATTFLISNTIRLTVFARRREIGVMKLVGATDWFIRWPFIMEGVLLGLLGTLVSIFVLNRVYAWFAATMDRTIPFLPLVSPQDETTYMLSWVLLGLGIVVGAFGSIFSLRRFLQV